MNATAWPVAAFRLTDDDPPGQITICRGRHKLKVLHTPHALVLSQYANWQRVVEGGFGLRVVRGVLIRERHLIRRERYL